MKPCMLFVTLMMAGIFTVFVSTAPTQEQDPPPEPQAPMDGVEPQTRGPLHEGFAVPSVATPQPSPIVPKKPPEPIEEAPPDEKPTGNNVQWIPGYWIFDDEQADYLWVSGFWRDVPPERRWVPGYWHQLDENGWQRVAGYWENLQQTDLELLPDPPHNIDAGPSIPEPSAESVYVPGTWVHREAHYLWRPGHWIAVQPGWVFVPAHYNWTPGGFVFCEGYWDFPLEARGLLFCPVRIHERHLSEPRWVYRPHYCVATQALFTALFARPSFGHYYFGDYFVADYQRAGFIPWMDYTVVRNTPNPLFAYYHARQDRDWVNNIRQVYTERRTGKMPSPPATFTQQTRVIQNITNITNVNNTIQINQQNFKVSNPKTLSQQLTMIAPMTQVGQVNTNIKLQRMTKESLIAVQKHVDQIHTLGKERKQFDVKHAQLIASIEQKVGQPTVRPAGKLTLPKVTASLTTSKEKTPHVQPLPPLPTTPKAVAVKPPAPKEFKSPRLDLKPNVIQPRKTETVIPKETKNPTKEEKALPKEEKVLPKDKVPTKETKNPLKEEKVLPKTEKTLPKETKNPPREEKILPKEEKHPIKPVVIPAKEEKTPPPPPPKSSVKPVPPKEEKTPPKSPEKLTQAPIPTPVLLAAYLYPGKTLAMTASGSEPELLS